jgi:hypothetical protein
LALRGKPLDGEEKKNKLKERVDPSEIAP